MARYEAKADFQRDYILKAAKASRGRSPGNDDEVSTISVVYINCMNIVLQGW